MQQLKRMLLSMALLFACGITRGQPAPASKPADALQEVDAEIERYADAQIEAADRERQASWHRDFSSIEAYERSVEPKRQELWDLLGGKQHYAPAPLDAKEELIGEFPTHRAYRVWLTAFPGVRVYGVLLVPSGRAETRSPALVCVHGMMGTPEGVCGLVQPPDYHHEMGLQAVRRGYVVFAPQNVNTPKRRSWLDRKLILAGQRLQALEQYKLVRAVDYLQSRKDVDGARIGLYGISWGGRTVMNGAALDRRIAACAISGHFNDLIPKMVRPSEHYTAYIQTSEDYAFFPGHARAFNDADVVSLICPRAVFIEQGKQDRVAYWEISQRAFEPVKEIYRKLGMEERAVYSIFDGPHEIHGTEAFAFFERWLKPSIGHHG